MQPFPYVKQQEFILLPSHLYLFICLFVFPGGSLFPSPFRNCMRQCSTKFTFKDLAKRSSPFAAQLKLLTQTSPGNAMECLRMAAGLYKHSTASKTKTFGVLIYIHHNTSLSSAASHSVSL